MDTNVLRTSDGSLFFTEAVSIEEETGLNEARNIYNTVDSIQATDETYDKAIKKICCMENMPQNIRRSERIQMKLIQKECNLASSPLTYEPTLNKTTNSQRKLKATLKKKQKSLRKGAPSSLVRSISQSSNKSHSVKVPECIEGIIKRNGKEYVAVKWKGQNSVEHVSTKNLTDNLKKLFVSYLQSHLLILSPNEENASSERDHASLERGNFACPEEEDHMQTISEIPICQEREEGSLCENNEDCYPVSQADEWSIHTNYRVKNTIPIDDVPSSHLQKINTLHYKRQQQLFIEKSGILNNYKASNIDIKLAF